MFSHIYIGVTAFDRAFGFYSALTAELGLSLKFTDAEKPWAAWMAADAPRPLLVIGAAFDGNAATPGNGQMVALLAANRATVDRAYATALANGGSCEGPPGLRPPLPCALLRRLFPRPGRQQAVCLLPRPGGNLTRPPRSLSDLMLFYCGKTGFGHFCRFPSLNSQLFASEKQQNCLKPDFSSLRTVKSDRLLAPLRALH